MPLLCTDTSFILRLVETREVITGDGMIVMGVGIEKQRKRNICTLNHDLPGCPTETLGSTSLYRWFLVLGLGNKGFQVDLRSLALLFSVPPLIL